MGLPRLGRRLVLTLALLFGLIGVAESGTRDAGRLLRSGKRSFASSASTSSSSSTSSTSSPSSHTNKVARAVCPDNCSGHGRCTTPIVRTTAEIPGSQGQGGITVLGGMFHGGTGAGGSTPPRCECYQGWSGENCNAALADLSMCGSGDLKRCSDGQGECVAKDPPPADDSTSAYECRCFHPYRGEACEQNLCPDHCSGRGKCHADGCLCIEGWTGPACATPLCARLNDCSGHGSCVLDEGAADYTTGGRCECDAPFTGPDCSSGGCPDDCSGHGVCGLGAMCECAPGWTGLSCAEKACGNGCVHGQCIEDDNQSANNGDGFADARGLVCLCDDGWRGDSCDLKDCPEPCGAYGDCGSDGTCVCDADWTGRLCEVPLCEKNCSFPNGQCVEQFGKHVCACNAPYQAPLCEHKDCPVDPRSGLVCAAHGVCSDGACICEPGYFGAYCTDRRCPKTPQYVLDHRPNPSAATASTASSDYAHGSGGIHSMSLFGSPTDPPALSKRRVLVACSGHGACTDHGNCDCQPGWQGDACDQIKCLHDCHHHGKCVPRLAQPGAPGGDELVDDYDAVSAEGDPTGVQKRSQKTRKHNADARVLDAHEATMPGRCACDAAAGWEGPYCGQKTCPSKAPPAQCSGHGTCLTGACYCQDGYTGDACHVKICPDLGSGTPCNERGMCVDGQCQCLKGYAGTACERPACPGEGEATAGGSEQGGKKIPLCGGHGQCQTTETKAEAEKTFAQLMVAYRMESADFKSGNVTSPPPMPEPPAMAGACICADGWVGLACHQMECPNLCSGNGDCVAATAQCECHDGFIGTDCSVLECRNGCSGHGVCARVNLTHPMAAANSNRVTAAYSDNDVDHIKFGTRCLCEPGWGGDHGDCAVEVMCVPSDAQSAHDNKESGVSASGKKAAWRRQSLSVLRATATAAWREKETRVLNDTLIGMTGMKAPQPSDPFAEAPFDCGFAQGHGRCVDGTCYCADGWSGKSCATRVCENECSGHGVCGQDSNEGPACICMDGWKGPSCENIACPRGGSGGGSGSYNDGGVTITGVEEECSGRGLCYYHNQTLPGRTTVKAAECVCSDGFAGKACELKQCPGDCGDGSGMATDATTNKPFVRRGTCDGKTGTCRCLPGWGGAECKKRECPGEAMPCSGHGTCDAATASCTCKTGWRGEACDASTCSGDQRGSWNPDQKRCDCVRRERLATDADAQKKADDMPPLYWGEFCEMAACPGYLESGSGFAADGKMAFCSGHGWCNGTELPSSAASNSNSEDSMSMGTCKCSAGFTGVDCSIPFGLRPAHEVAREIEELAKERAQSEIDAEKEESRAPGAERRPGLEPGQGPSVSTIRMRLELQFRAEGINLAGQVLPAIAKGVARFSGLHSGVVRLTTELNDDIKNDQPGGIAEVRGGLNNATVRAEMVKYVDYEDELAGNSTVVGSESAVGSDKDHVTTVYHSECIVDVTISVRTGSVSESAFGALDRLSSATHDALVVSKSRTDLCAAIVPRQGGVCLQDAMHVLNGPQIKSRELTANEIADFILMEGEGESQALNVTEKARMMTAMEKEEGISMDAAEEVAIDADHNQKASGHNSTSLGERSSTRESGDSDEGYGDVMYPSVHDSVATVVTQDSISAKGSAALQAEALRVRKHHEREADLETAKILGGSDEDLHEPLRNEDVGDDVIGAAGTVVGNLLSSGDEMEPPTVEEQQHMSGSSGSGSQISGSSVGASEQRFAEETMQFFGLRQHRRRR